MPSVLVIDNVDSFTFTLIDYLLVLGAEVRVIRSTDIGVQDALSLSSDAILISPGPGKPEDAGISVDLARACIDARRPLLGVCLGHQAIALACCGEVGQVPPVHGKTTRIRHDGSGLFAGLPPHFEVTRYHSLAITLTAGPLLPNAWSEDDMIQAVRHAEAPVHGVQFHPESVASQHGHALLSAFLGKAERRG
ncbi:anthranilate synthase component II [Sphingomonas sp. GCM10030256]|uniref:anthranilate synthase component II n=1 Tax=Sphingomonas sp. GCM10030256 TaxID=3273427 RepID=UPI003610B37C